MPSKASLRTLLIGLLISAACIAIVLRNVELGESWAALRQIRLALLPLPLLILAINLPLRAWRWQQIFPPAARPSLWNSLAVLAVGNMGNNLFPGRVGDLSRCVLIGRKSSLSQSTLALATLVVEKILDGLALLAVVLFSLWVLSPPHWVWRLGGISALIFGGALAVLVLLRFRAEWFLSVVRRCFQAIHLAHLGEKLAALLAAFAEGLHAIGSAGQMARLLAATAAIWFTEAALIWAFARAFHAPLGLQSSFVVAAVIGLGFMIPAAPAGLGTYELFGVAAFQLVGVAAAGALAITLAIHAWVFVSNNGVGLLCLALLGVRFSQLRNAGAMASGAQTGASARDATISTLPPTAP